MESENIAIVHNKSDVEPTTSVPKLYFSLYFIPILAILNDLLANEVHKRVQVTEN
jgi:hypothetical protein